MKSYLHKLNPVYKLSLNKKKRKRLMPLIGCILLIWLCVVMIYQTHKPLPAGVSMEGPVHHVKDIDFLYDMTYKRSEMPIQEQNIFDRVWKAVEEAQQFIVIDMFLYNGYTKEGTAFPALSETLTDKLIEQKKKHPTMPIVVISDDVNTTYGSHASKELDRLRQNGIQVVLTDVNPLRDSTPLYSAVWRVFFQWFGESGSGWLPNPMANSAPHVTLRSYLKLLNVKANHRKVIATEQTLIVTSANAHDASGYNSNTAFEVQGSVIRDALQSEQAAVQLTTKGTGQGPVEDLATLYKNAGTDEGDIEVQFLTEGKIYSHVLKALAEAGAGDTVWMGMFYLADRKVIDELLNASARGVEIRLILDPNQNAFGRDKIGLPNRPVADELLQKSGGRIKIRWYNTGQEQFHTKLMFIDKRDRAVINNGSANYTKRNLDDLNLETNLGVTAPRDSKVAREVRSYFNRLWNNEDAEYTLNYEAYHDNAVPLKKVLNTLQRVLGFTTY